MHPVIEFMVWVALGICWGLAMAYLVGPTGCRPLTPPESLYHPVGICR